MIDTDETAGVIDFSQGHATLLLGKVGELLQDNEEADFYCDLDGEHYALNAIIDPEEGLQVMVSQITPAKKGKTPELLAMCILREEDGSLMYAPYIDDDKKLSRKAMALTHSIERIVIGKVAER